MVRSPVVRHPDLVKVHGRQAAGMGRRRTTVKSLSVIQPIYMVLVVVASLEVACLMMSGMFSEDVNKCLYFNSTLFSLFISLLLLCLPYFNFTLHRQLNMCEKLILCSLNCSVHPMQCLLIHDRLCL